MQLQTSAKLSISHAVVVEVWWGQCLRLTTRLRLVWSSVWRHFMDALSWSIASARRSQTGTGRRCRTWSTEAPAGLEVAKRWVVSGVLCTTCSELPCRALLTLSPPSPAVGLRAGG